MTVQEMAAKGRFGDSVIAHLTPGEVTVPPEVLQKFPQLKVAIAKALGHMGVSIEQFTAGSPHVVTNPNTGAPEQSIFGALLPVLGGVLGTMLLPGIGTGLGLSAGMAGIAGGAVGGGLGGLAGSMVDKTSPVMGLLGGAAGGGLGAAGGISALGDIGSGAASATGTMFSGGPVLPAADAAASTSASTVAAGGAEGGNMAMSAPSVAAGAANPIAGATIQPDWLERNLGVTPQMMRAGTYAGIGTTLAGAFGGSTATSTSTGTNNDPNYNNPNALVPPAGSTPNSLLGNSVPNTPTFAGFNPQIAAQPGNSYNFYPQPGTSPFG